MGGRAPGILAEPDITILNRDPNTSFEPNYYT